MTTPDSEIGARLSLRNRAQFVSDAKQAAAAVDEVGGATKVAGEEAATSGAHFQTFSDRMDKSHGPISKVTSGLKSMVGYFAGFFALEKTIQFFKDTVNESNELAKAQRGTSAALKSTHDSSGQTTKSIAKQAEALSHLSGQSVVVTQNLENMILTFPKIKGKQFDEAGVAAANLAARLGVSLPSAARMVGRALNDPVLGLTSLSRVGIRFTDQQKNMLTNMLATGHAAQAQQYILTTLNQRVGGAAKAAITPSEKLHLALEQMELTLGKKLLPTARQFETWLTNKGIPDLEKFGGWLDRNKGSIEFVAKALTIALIPATAMYVGYLASKGISTVANMWSWMTRSQAVIGKTGAVAEGQVTGISRMGQAVMGVTAAIGVFELGKATAGHGAGGALVAGLGGAVVGMVIGLSMGGPFGAAIGGAIGGLVGLAGHFMGTSKSTDAAAASLNNYTTALANSLESQYKHPAKALRQDIQGYVSQQPGVASTLNQYGITMPQLYDYLVTGKSSKGLKALTTAANKPGANQDLTNAFNSLSNWGTEVAGAITNFQSVLKLLHPDQSLPAWIRFFGEFGLGAPTPSFPGGAKTKKKAKRRAMGGDVSADQPYVVGEQGDELFVPQTNGRIVPHGTVSSLTAKGATAMALAAGGPSTPVVLQVMLDKKVLAEATYEVTRDKAART